ncbi:hypothetical protein LFM09_10280 [Lentzea alba]|uniref:hypothetical protein n=1 Tax=Lentzea alba TaxID=2714351 RepID=UPI0039BEDB7C
MPLLRVLWMLAQGMVWQWLMTGLCEKEAVDRAIAERLVRPPVGDHLGYHLTDEGHQRLVTWYLKIAPQRDHENFAQQWKKVTYR